MKNINAAIILATIFIITEQSMIAYRDRSNDDSRPKHQGFGRIGTAIENTVTLHPGNAVNALATGDQADTTFGWHEDENDRVKANRAHTYHNNNKSYDRHDRRRDDRRHDRQDERYHETSKETHKQRKQAHEQRRENERESNEGSRSRRWFW